MSAPPTSLPKTPSWGAWARGGLSQPVVASFIAGGVAGAVSRTVVSPLERLKILFQIQSVGREEYKLSVPKALMKMWKEEGWRGFMRGNGTNCVRIVPYSAVQFGSYNFYKRVCCPSRMISSARLTMASSSLRKHLDQTFTRIPSEGSSVEALQA